MSGGRESPQERRARLILPDGTEVDPDARPVILDPEDSPSYGRRSVSGENRSLVASGARLKLDDRRAADAMRRRRQAWQSEAYDYSEELPELGHTLEYAANLLSKLHLFSAVQPDPKAPPIPVEDEESGVDATEAKIATETLARLRALAGGQSSIVADTAYHFEAVGEALLHGHEDPETGEEDWQVRSIDELTVQGTEYVLRAAPGVNVFYRLDPGDIVCRLWTKNRRFSGLAMSGTRRVLSVSENLLLLDRELRSTSQSRLPNGLLVLSQDYSFGPRDPTQVGGGAGESRKDQFLADLDDAMRTAIQEPGAASAAIPITMLAPRDQVKDGVNYVSLGRDSNDVLDKRIEGQVMRLARGLNQPVEVTRGLADTTFANAFAAKKSEWDAYGEPKAVAICDALTAGYYQWALVEAGLPPDRARLHFIWYDPANCIAAPDPVDNADLGLENGVVSEEAWRRVKGFSEADAPDDVEILRRLVLKLTRQDPFIAAQLLRITGLAPDIELPAQGSGGSQGAVTAAATPRRVRPSNLGRRLAALDRDLRTRLRGLCEASLRRVLQQAGNKVARSVQRDRSGGPTSAYRVASAVPAADVCATLGRGIVAAAGITDEDLLAGAFADLADDWDNLTRAAQRKALADVEATYGPLDEATRTELESNQDRGRSRGWEVLLVGLTAVATSRLFEPPGTVTTGEGDQGGVPAGIVRDAMIVAGGGDPDVPGGTLATGPDVLGAVATLGGDEGGWVWDYGPYPRTSSFEPHEDLDGVEFASFDDPVLANDTGWPSDLLYPGDHQGCLCDAVPILTDAETETPPEGGE